MEEECNLSSEELLAKINKVNREKFGPICEDCLQFKRTCTCLGEWKNRIKNDEGV